MEEFIQKTGSRFVASGSAAKESEDSDPWREAEQAIEQRQRQREEASNHNDGKSLYETLQANKAAKEEAFQESIKLRNQFRSLDEDEAEFLDSILESTRVKEAAIKKETSEQLEVFRRNQEEADRAAALKDDESTTIDPAKPVDESPEAWAVGSRRRKKGNADSNKLLKLRKTSTGEAERVKPPAAMNERAKPLSPRPSPQIRKTSPVPQCSSFDSKSGAEVPKASLLGLGAYSSDED